MNDLFPVIAREYSIVQLSCPEMAHSPTEGFMDYFQLLEFLSKASMFLFRLLCGLCFHFSRVDSLEIARSYIAR